MGAMAWHMLVSRNGKYLLLNCADGALRLYPIHDLGVVEDLKPKLFQDVVSKEPFVCCDFSGDAEYLVGGCNGQNEKYELYLWNTSTGALMDRLTGAQVQLYSVAWHPTRSFLAVATSDGLVDIWGPRMDWTAFAPDFQALPMNVEYVEREDEFDLVEEQEEDAEAKELEDFVDVVTVDPVPVFASDSESESEVFAFDTKIHQVVLINRGRPSARSDKTGIEDKD
jgi:COMPASS component SWD1